MYKTALPLIFLTQKDIAEKTVKTLISSGKVLGEIPPTQSERKYLIKNPSQELLDKLQPVEQIITQSYLISRKDGTERRSRKVQNNGSIGYYYIEKQQMSPVERIETERMLTQKEYVRLMDEVNPDYGTIVKRRYSFHYLDHYMTIDTYASSPSLAILDVQVANKDDKVEFPEELTLIREVTEEIRYQGHMIAKAQGVLAE